MKIKRLNQDNVCKINSSYIDDKEIQYITFPILDKTNIVNHLFTTRLGGVSESIYSEMNMSYSRGDIKEHVDENYNRVCKILQCEKKDIVCSSQNHTTNIHIVTEKDKGKGVIFDRDFDNVDGLITNIPNIFLCTYYADCVPLFIVDTRNKAIGLSHSGWRGTINRMGQVTLDKMHEMYGTTVNDVVVAIGPSICQECYEVSKDVADEFIKEFGPNKELVYLNNKDKYQLNLHFANKKIFLDAGVKEDKIQVTDICTCCNPDLLFSHRKTNGKRGNLAAFLSLK